MDPYQPSPYAPPRPQPGAETRRLLLVLGSLCLVVALGAGTTLVFSRLGPGGQLALMAGITVALLAAAAAVRRLPATAEALGAVGLAGVAIDLAAARTLGLPAATRPSLHGYVAVGAVLVAATAVVLDRVAPRLAVAPATWSVALVVAATAAVDPSDPSRAPLLAPVGVALAVVLAVLLRPYGDRGGPARALSGLVTLTVVVLGYCAALAAAAVRQPSAVAGIAVPLALLVLPLLSSRRLPAVAELVVPAGVAAGLTAAALTVAAVGSVPVDVRTAAALALPVLAVVVAAVPVPVRWSGARAAAVALPGAVGTVAWLSLLPEERAGAGVDLALAAVAAAVAVAWPRDRESAAAVRSGALGAATLLASLGAGLALDLQGVSTPEAYVATPALLWAGWAVALLTQDRRRSSAVLVPVLTVGLLPTVVLALAGDHQRQAVALVAGALLVMAGAQLRLTVPMAAGAGVVVLLCARLAGPVLAELPRWLVTGAVGAVLLVLGATWEARLQQARLVTDRLRPYAAALR